MSTLAQIKESRKYLRQKVTRLINKIDSQVNNYVNVECDENIDKISEMQKKIIRYG